MDHVLFPRFWVEEPALWFAQVEAVFALNSITSDSDKYDYILCELPSTVISLIKDLILDSTNANENGKYKRIKQELIKRISISELKKEEIGTKKPSEFLKYLREKADPLVPETIVKELWLNSLPLHVKYIVSGMKCDVEMLCQLADTVKEVLPTPNNSWILEKQQEAVTIPNFPTESISKIFEQLTSQLENIQSELQMIKFICSEKNRVLCEKCQATEEKSATEAQNSTLNIQSNSNTSISNDASENNVSVNNVLNNTEVKSADVLCWYHRLYAEKAHHCIAPCNFPKTTGQENNNTSF